MKWISKLKAKHSANTMYERIGGQQAVERVANTFYDIMESDPFVKDLYQIHPQPLNEIRITFTQYLVMWLGGPDYYTPKRGRPRLRARHLPFKINAVLKEQWMYCIRKAMTMHVHDTALRGSLLNALDQLAEHMVNSN